MKKKRTYYQKKKLSKRMKSYWSLPGKKEAQAERVKKHWAAKKSNGGTKVLAGVPITPPEIHSVIINNRKFVAVASVVSILNKVFEQN